MNIRLRLQLSGFFFGSSVTQKVSATDFWTSEVFQQVRPTQRWMDFDMKMEAFIRLASSGRLMQGHHIGKRHPPKIIQPDKQAFEGRREITQLRLLQSGDACMRFFRSDVDFISIASKVRKKCDR